ncbi:hypothetical protein GOBAR_AA05677 [Gossypium barbadense]|uniref:DUF4283 domain-containing protein n=1 Tax=Gossypium barbadense TaxID=3634 RepID=A0A2P5YH33_GOSBA|nr:hypothetical protein GOBAR_AA05677 [Gossypium barbadense]
MEANIANLNMDDEKEALIPYIKRVLDGMPWSFNMHLLVFHQLIKGEDPKKLGHGEGFFPVRKTIGTQEVKFGWDLSLRAPTMNELLVKSKWLREKKPVEFQIGNKSVDMKIDRWKNGGLDEDVTF